MNLYLNRTLATLAIKVTDLARRGNHAARTAARILTISTLVGFALLPFGTSAQSYPEKTVRLIVPYAPGGTTDVTARLVAKALSERLGRPFVVENRPGAGGSIGHDVVAKAAADGYTLLFSAAGPLVVTPHTYPTLPYDPKGFEPISLVSTAPLLLVVNPKLKASTMQDLIAEARASGKMTYGSFGNGSAAHLAGELFKATVNVDLVHVPYKGSAPALTDLVGGQIDLMFDVLGSSIPLVKAGKLRALAVTSAQRTVVAPEVPTMAELGLRDFEAGTWFGLLAPPATNKQVISTLAKAMEATLALPDVREAILAQGSVVAGGSPEDFRKFFNLEFERWGKVVRIAKIKAD
jgi:tripartite-type tricarboxylate transporter receptor subunit TctC